jgi:hypothetical protein
LGRNTDESAVELDDFDLDVEVGAEDAAKAFAVALRGGEAAGEMEFGDVGHGVAMPEGIHSDAEEGADVHGIAVGIACELELAFGGRDLTFERGFPAVKGCGELTGGPGAVEETDHPVVEEVEEPGEGAVLMDAFAIAGELGEVKGEGSIGTEHAEEVDEESLRRLVGCVLEFGDGAGREGEAGFLTEAERILPNRVGTSDAWNVGIEGFEAANEREEVELPRGLCDCVQEVMLGIWVGEARGKKACHGGACQSGVGGCGILTVVVDGEFTGENRRT